MDPSTGIRARLKTGVNVITAINRPHPHKPLPSPDYTRMLVVYAKDGAKDKGKDDEIHADLVNVKFQDLRKLKYVALSYTWGDDRPDKWILIHEKISGLRDAAKSLQDKSYRYELPSRRHLVRQNLFSALHAVRQDTKDVMLWIDAICINQEDGEEKAAQFAQINLVYERARSVLVWLGPATDRTDRAMDFAKEVVDLQAVNSLANDKSRTDDWESLEELIKRGWFGRRWIIQELALNGNANVRCGPKQVPWNVLRDAISLMADYSNDIRRLFKQSGLKDHNYWHLADMETLVGKVLVDTIHNIFRRNRDGEPLEPIQSLEYLVTTLARFRSSDPRDTINALRNIAKETRGYGALKGSKAPPTPDYSIDKTLLMIYIDFVKWIYDTYGRIDIICHRWALPERKSRPTSLYTGEFLYPELSKLPSWIQTVPEEIKPGNADNMTLTSRRRLHGEPFAGVPGERPYNCSLSVPAKVNFPNAMKTEPPRQTGSLSRNTPPETPSSPQDEGSQSAWAAERPDQPDQAATQQAQIPSTSSPSQRPPSSLFDVYPDLPDEDDLGMADDSDPLPNGVSVSSTTSQSDGLRDSPNGFDASLSVEGIQIGTISKRYDRMVAGIIHREVIEGLQRKTSQEVPDRLWRGLVAERGSDGRNPPATYWRACKLILEQHADNNAIDTRELLTREQGISNVEKEYLHRVQAVTYNRSFFEAKATQGPKDPESSKELLQGFGPGEIQADDIVCVLFGCSVPVILRPFDQTLQDFKLIGECYVYGMMDGDAIVSLGDSLSRVKRAFRIM